MGYMYQGDAVLNASLTVESPKPLDTRTVVEDIENLYSIPESSAYRGMTVANINDGNLYMLIDKTKIKEKAGWKASYESIQIITCTQEEYDTWSKNTTEDYKPIDGNLTYLRRDVYYYIYENEDSSQYYVTKKQIEDWLKVKASTSDLSSLATSFSEHVATYNKSSETLNTNITEIIAKFDNYFTSEQISEIYATKESLKETDDKFGNYYTSKQVTEMLDSYVTKESLKGGLGDGEEDFVFVTQSQYDTDKTSNAESFSTKELKLGEMSITSDNTSVLANSKELAFKEIVPKIELITKEEYDNKEEYDPDTYYYLFDDGIIGYITENAALEKFYTRTQVDSKIAKAKQELIDEYIVPLQNELAALKNS